MDNVALNESEKLIKSPIGVENKKQEVEKRVEDLAKGFIDQLLVLKQEIIDERSKPLNINFPDIQKVVGDIGVIFPEIQKISGRVEIANFPGVQEIKGNVGVIFPNIQKIEGNVTAVLKGFEFPDVQKIEGNVNVQFPSMQKVNGDVRITNLPIGRGVRRDLANPTEYIPVRLTNGQEFYDAMGSVARSSGSNETLLKSIESVLRGTLSVSITGGGGTGGTQYTEGDAVAAPIGTIAHGYDGANVRALMTDTTGALQTIGNIAAGSADSGNPVKVGGKYNSTKPTLTDGQRTDLQTGTRGALSVQLAVADGIATPVGTTSTSTPGAAMYMGMNNSSSQLMGLNSGAVAPDGANGNQHLVVANAIFNGSTWDRSRTAINGLNSTGTGLPVAAGAAQFDDTSPTAITENSFGNLRISANRNLYDTIRDAAGNERGANVTANNELLVGVATGATGLGKVEDTAHSTGDVGVMFLAVRNDTGAVLAGTDGDYIPVTTDATGAMRVDLNGIVSTGNSSSATLLSGAAFTGTSEDCLNYNEIRITVIASHASATDGLSIQQSSDNTNWDVTDVYTIPATTGKTYSVPRQARYVRVVYTNGGTNQSSFRLQTILNRLGSRVSSQRPGDAYTNETDLEQTQSFNMLYNGTTWDRARSALGVTGALAIGGLTASGSSLAVAPITVGGLAKTANPTAVADGQVVNSLHDKLGKQVVVGSIRDLKADQQTSISSSVTETTIVTAVASTFLDLYGLIITNTSATVCKVTIRDDTAGTIRAVLEIPATETRGFMLPESGGLKQAVVNKPWTATCGTSVATIEISALFVKNI